MIREAILVFVCVVVIQSAIRADIVPRVPVFCSLFRGMETSSKARSIRDTWARLLLWEECITCLWSLLKMQTTPIQWLFGWTEGPAAPHFMALFNKSDLTTLRTVCITKMAINWPQTLTLGTTSPTCCFCNLRQALATQLTRTQHTNTTTWIQLMTTSQLC